uniref:SHCtransforming protein 1like [Acyrthosiphon pisum] n=1 Tax=Lepeophtheirus salmonis TaxID=72036 RepID=A0A0K2VDS7_LEPSM
MGSIAYMTLEDRGFYSDESFLIQKAAELPLKDPSRSFNENNTKAKHPQTPLPHSRGNNQSRSKNNNCTRSSFSNILQHVIHKLHDHRRKSTPRFSKEVTSASEQVTHSSSSTSSSSSEICVPCELLGDTQRRRSLTRRLFKDFKKATSAASSSTNDGSTSPPAPTIGGSAKSSSPPSRNSPSNLSFSLSTESLEDRLRFSQLNELTRQTRSLERNHRHLVDIDSSCRYSREVGSTQVSVDLPRPSLGRSSSSIDFNLRYQPDPTSACKKIIPPPPPITTTTPKTTSKRMSLRSSNLNIVSKPARGWLHPDILFVQDGINFAVQYIGSLKVNTSMKVLDFDTRSAIAKECINRVCEAAGRQVSDNKRTTDPNVTQMLDDSPNMEQSGSSFQLTVTSLWLKLSDYDTGKAVLTHIMPNISFASGGDADTSNYVAYVAKDKTHGGTRSCYVIECTGGRAQEVITTIGQAFELRFKEYLKRAPPIKQQHSVKSMQSQGNSSKSDDVEYYNDLPGKKPPLEPRESMVSASNNLIDFNTEIGPSVKSEPEYINGDVVNASREEKLKVRDPFDMSPFPANSSSLPSPVTPQLPTSCAARGGGSGDIVSEVWFHGPISRKESEILLQKDGDFLVRESLGSPGQYVLTGMQNNSKKHLLLVDPQGIVRTKDRSFDSVSHLVNHHLDNGLPIISAESTLRLLFPVYRYQT